MAALGTAMSRQLPLAWTPPCQTPLRAQSASAFGANRIFCGDVVVDEGSHASSTNTYPNRHKVNKFFTSIDLENFKIKCMERGELSGRGTCVQLFLVPGSCMCVFGSIS